MLRRKRRLVENKNKNDQSRQGNFRRSLEKFEQRGKGRKEAERENLQDCRNKRIEIERKGIAEILRSKKGCKFTSH